MFVYDLLFPSVCCFSFVVGVLWNALNVVFWEPFKLISGRHGFDIDKQGECLNYGHAATQTLLSE